MAISAQIIQSIPIGTSRKDVVILLTDTGNYRVYTFNLIANAIDPLAGANLQTLWNAGTTPTATQIEQYKQMIRTGEEYARALIRAVRGAANLTAALTAMNAIVVTMPAEMQAEITAFRTAINLSGAPANDSERRDLLFAGLFYAIRQLIL